MPLNFGRSCAAAFLCLVLASCLTPAPQESFTGTYNLPFDQAVALCRDTLSQLGFEVLPSGRLSGRIETDWRREMSGARGYLEMARAEVRVVPKPGGFCEVFVTAIKRENLDPKAGASESDALWGLEEPHPRLEAKLHAALDRRLRMGR